MTKIRTWAAIGLVSFFTMGSAHAQLDYTDIKTGSVLDGKGIRLGAFIKPVPLPPGDWLVVARNDSRIPLTGGMDMNTTSTGLVALTLKSTDADNGIFSMVVSFTPDSTRVNWNDLTCPGTNRAFAFNVAGNGRLKGCASGQWFSSGLRKFLRGAPTHAAAMARDQYGPLAPYADQAPEPYAQLYLSARRDSGRSLEYAIDTRIPKDFVLGSNFDAQVRDWAKNSTQSMMDMLENTITPMAAFPNSASANAVVRNKDSGPLGIALPALVVGSEVSTAITIPNYSTSLPMPPGRWVVANRHNIPLDGQLTSTTLTLRNTDPTAALAAMVMTVQPAQFNSAAAMGRCNESAKKQFQIVEDMGTSASSTVSVCAVGGLYAASLKQMVRNAPTSNTLWFKQNLASLAPYEADMPDTHIWLSFEAGRNAQMRVVWALYVRTPDGLRPSHLVDGPLREWVRSVGQSMLDFHNNRYTAVGPYPTLVASP